MFFEKKSLVLILFINNLLTQTFLRPFRILGNICDNYMKNYYINNILHNYFIIHLIGVIRFSILQELKSDPIMNCCESDSS